MTQPPDRVDEPSSGPGFRLASGGRIDRSQSRAFEFNGRQIRGFRGDTLASALIAAGVDMVSASISLGRPRGVITAGPEEPGALVEVVNMAGTPEAILPATQVELVDGLSARSVVGRGRADAAADQGRFDKRFVHCDVLVVGGGPAGLAAAVAAGRTGARVILVDEGPELGGTLLGTQDVIDGAVATTWVASVAAELGAQPETRVLDRATALGVYDGNFVTIAQRPPGFSSGRLWHVRARQIVLATGAHERPIVFADNDRPGVMLAGAARTFVNRFGVAPGARAVVFTTNDGAYAAALELARAGIEVAAIVDARPVAPRTWSARAGRSGIEVLVGRAVVGTEGDDRVAGALVAPLDADGEIDGPARRLGADLLVTSGGWNPAVHLFTHAGGTVRYEEPIGAFVPNGSVQAQRVAGAARGVFELGACLADGHAAGSAAAADSGFTGSGAPPPAVPPLDELPARILWLVPATTGGPGSWRTHFVDLQRDATVADIHRAVGSGLRSIEHVKRYTLIGTAADQGKTSGVATIGIVASLLGLSPAELGTTTFRPPYSPVPFALVAGRDRGHLYEPVRVTSIHPWHVARGAVMEPVGQWHRPRHFPNPGEDMDAAVLRECRAARDSVAVMDASTLGKIDIQGPDAGVFLDRIYTNGFSKLAVGSCRYGVMLRLDGMVFDDGVTTRLAPDRYHMTTTTGNAAPVLDWLDEWLQTEWTDLRVRCTSVTEQWATVALVGPNARRVLARLAPDLDVSREAFPFMTVREADVAGLAARVFRISFSGELAYEINVPSWSGLELWEAVMAAGASFGITPYGTQALHVLRAEKGFFIVGQETDGTVTPHDLGLDWIVSKTKDFLGRRSLQRADLVRPDRPQLVGLLPVDPDALLPEGAQLVADPAVPIPMPMIGHVTSSYRSAALGRTFALAMVKGGLGRHGETVYAPLPGTTIAATISSPVLLDPENARRDGLDG